MTVGDLLSMLRKHPRDAVILVPSHDHSYRIAGCEAGTALYDDRTGHWTEDCGEDWTPEEAFGKRVPVIIIT